MNIKCINNNCDKAEKESILKTQKDLKEALDINDEVIHNLLFLLQLRNKLVKLKEQISELKTQIKEKDEAIFELGLFYEVSIKHILLFLQNVMKNEQNKNDQ